MATTKTLTPTNQAITLAAFTEKPDNRTNVTNDDKLADAVNALNSNFNDMVKIKSLGIGGNQTIANIKNVCANASFSGMTMDYLYMNDSAVTGWSLVMCSVKMASSSRVTIWILNPSKIITSDTGNLSDWTQKTVNLS